MSAGAMPRVSRPPTTTRFSTRARGGSSHSKVTPTSCSPRPRAYTISVADGNNDTKRTRPSCLVARARLRSRSPGDRDGQDLGDGPAAPAGDCEEEVYLQAVRRCGLVASQRADEQCRADKHVCNDTHPSRCSTVDGRRGMGTPP